MVKMLWYILLLVAPAVVAVKIRNQQPLGLLQNVRVIESATQQDSISSSRDLQAECNLDQDRQLGASIVLDFYGEPHLLSSGEQSLVGSTILETYNAITLCDTDTGQSREVTAVEIASTEFQDLGERFFTLEYTVTGTCRGCNSTTTLLDYVLLDGRARDICPCRGPTAYSFQVLLEERLWNLIQGRKIINIESLEIGAELEDTPSCPAFSTFTTSDVVVEFFGCPVNLQQADLDILADRFVETYNRINGLNSRLCDRFFREIMSATAVLSDDYDVQNNGRAADVDRQMEDANLKFPMGGRSLQEDGVFECPDYFEIRFDVTARCRGCDVQTITLFDEEEDVNFFESFDDDYYYVSNATETNVSNTTDDDFFNATNLTIVEEGDGDLRRVEDDGNGEIGNDDGEWDRRRLRVKVAMDYLGGQPFATHRRRLQQSACRCPIDPEYRAVTEQEMIDALDLTLDFSDDTLPPLTVEDAIEIEDVDCDPNVENFQTSVDLEFYSDSQDGVINNTIANTLAASFIRSYNSLAERFCDPLFRYVETAEVVNNTATPAGRDRALLITPNTFFNFNFTYSEPNPVLSNFSFVFSFNFFFAGVCRGCPGGADLFGVSIQG